MREDCVFCRTEFIVTASCDGHVKFWKKQPEGIEFVKHIRAHMSRWWIVKLHPKPHPLNVGKIESMAASCDGFLLSTTSDDKSLKIFDVKNFGKKLMQQCYPPTLSSLCSDMFNMFRLKYQPSHCGSATPAVPWSVLPALILSISPSLSLSLSQCSEGLSRYPCL